MRFIVIDIGVQPAIVVHQGDSEREAHGIAENYARTHGRRVILGEFKRAGEVDAPLAADYSKPHVFAFWPGSLDLCAACGQAETSDIHRVDRREMGDKPPSRDGGTK